MPSLEDRTASLQIPADNQFTLEEFKNGVAMAMAEQPKGWFSTLGLVNRTPDQQLNGLIGCSWRVWGKTVLDVGCAEGLISIELAKAGAIAKCTASRSCRST